MPKDANIAAQQSLSKNSNAGDLDTAMQTFAPDAIDNDLAPGQSPDRVGFTALFGELPPAFPDVKIEPEKTFADEENVAVPYTLTGTHEGDVHKIPATGRTIEVQDVQLSRFENGQIVERWRSSNEPGIMQQLGAEVAPKSGLAKLANRLGA